MSKRLFLSVLLTASVLLAACAPGAAPTAAAAATNAAVVQPTTAPAASASEAGANASSIKVGLVTDTAGVKDQAFNQMAWEGVQKAAQEMGFQAKFLESQQPADRSDPNDYEKNIDALVGEGYNVIITIGPSMGDATASKAKQYPNIKFAIVDNATVISGLGNVTSLMFAEEQVGFLAGVLAGGMSKSGFVCSISSLRTPASDRYVKNFHGGAVWQAGPEMKVMNNYINLQTTEDKVPNFADATQGKETALKLIGNGCDVVFGVGGEAVNGALLAAREKNVMAVGADVDAYNTDPEAQPALITSAMKKVDIAVYNYLKTVADGSVKAGISTASLQNDGVGLAPFHAWDSKIPADLKAQIQKASDGIKDGSIKMDQP